MNEPTMQTLTRRLDRVERENRRLKQVGVVALAVIATVGLMVQTTQQGKVVEAEQVKANEVKAYKVEAREFVLKDSSGKTRAALFSGGLAPFAFGYQLVSLEFFDEKGNSVGELGAVHDAYKGVSNAILLLGNEKQNHFVGITSGPKRAKLGIVNQNDGASLTLQPGRGIVLRLGGKKLLEKDTKARAELALSADDSPHLTLSDKDGKVIWSAP